MISQILWRRFIVSDIKMITSGPYSPEMWGSLIWKNFQYDSQLDSNPRDLEPKSTSRRFAVVFLYYCCHVKLFRQVLSNTGLNARTQCFHVLWGILYNHCMLGTLHKSCCVCARFPASASWRTEWKVADLCTMRFALLCDSDFSNESESYNLILIQLLKLNLGEQHGASLI